MKKICLLSIIGMLLLSLNTVVTSSSFNNGIQTDFDPLVDVSITVEIKTIRFLDINDLYMSIKASQDDTPNFYVKVFINDIEFTSNVWNNTKYVYDPQWSATLNVPDDQEFVNVKIQLWSDDVPYDISGDRDTYDVNLVYSIKTGHWTGDDSIGDPSGYGRLCGCDDGTIYGNDRNCELWFDITQNDYDGDHIPYWIEVNSLGTDPTINDSTLDPDHDNISTYWEYKWGYDPLKWEDHKNIDPDNDSINNIEEFLTSQWLSDPFRRDLFLEMDYMDVSPNGEQSIVPEASREQLKNPFHRRNIVFHFDTGELNGGELIPFDPLISFDEVIPLYNQYFLHNDSTTWRRGVFHYGIYVYSTKPNGYGFSGDVEPFMGYLPGTNSFIISSKQMEKNTRLSSKSLEYFYAAATMHEMGHTMGIRNGHPPGCDVQLSKYPWQPGWWIYRTYKSIMNYHYTYRIFDYSDGSHGVRDFDDWSNLNFSHFEIPENYAQ
jgi:hypothetical protein